MNKKVVDMKSMAVVDMKSMAKEIEYTLDVCGYKLSEFKVDVLTGALDIKAKEKTADGGTSDGQA